MTEERNEDIHDPVHSDSVAESGDGDAAGALNDQAESDQAESEALPEESQDPDGATGAEAPEEAPSETGSKEPDPDPDPGHLRLLEAVLFAAPEPLTEKTISERLPEGAETGRLLSALETHYRNHGVNLVCAGNRWFFRTAEDLAEQLKVYQTVPRRLSRAAMETLSIVAYHQPVTRAEIEEIRGVSLSRGTLDMLMECGWIGPKGHRQTAGRPTTWGTTPQFLTEFGLEDIKALPGLDELKAAGLLDKRPAIQITDVQGLDEDQTEEDTPLESAMDDESRETGIPEPDTAEHDDPHMGGDEGAEPSPQTSGERQG